MELPNKKLKKMVCQGSCRGGNALEPLGEWVGEWSGAEIQISNINRGLVRRGVAELFAESRTAPEDAVLCQRALGRSETTHRLAPKDAVSVWCVVVVVSQRYGHFSPVYDRPCFLLCAKRHSSPFTQRYIL